MTEQEKKTKVDRTAEKNTKGDSGSCRGGRRRYVFVAKTLGALLSEQSIEWQVRSTLSEIRVSSDVAP